MSRPALSLYLLPLVLSFPLLSLPLSNPVLPMPFPFPRTYPRAAPRQKRYIIPTTYGGTGNQLYFLLEAIHVAHHTNSTLLLPPPPPRILPNRPSSTPSHNIDVARLSSLLPLAEKLPGECHNSFTHVIHARRGKRPPTSFSSRVLTIACHFTSADYINTRKCGETALRQAVVHHLHLPLSHLPNPSLHRLLSSLSGCVLLDGHSYNRAGEKAQEALHSYLHYLQSSHAIHALASAYRVDVVVHLRYDEHECFRKRAHRAGFVCVRTRLSTHEGVVQWIDPGLFANVIVTEARTRGLRRVYLAFSPYVPVAMVTRLQDLFQKDLILVPRIRHHEHYVENLVERQLATNAKLFIGDFGSTWSGTVYYKRRTLDKATVWACRLLDICNDLGHYRFEGVLRKPEWFQSVGLL